MTPHFEHPAGAWILLAAAPILALYLLRHRRPPRKIPSLLLFRQTERDRKAQKTWRRLLPELSLLLQLLLVALFALGAARPTWTGGQRADATLAIVLDLSASMATREGTETRITQAKAEARTLLEEHASSNVFLVLAGNEPRLAAGRDARSLHDELEAVDAEDSGADLEKSVLLAEEKLRGAATPRIVVLTDVNARYETDRPTVQLRRFGRAHPNVGIYGARATRLESKSNGSAGVELSAIVISFADEERDVRVGLRAAATVKGERYERGADGAPLDVRQLHLLPQIRTKVRFVLPARDVEGAYELTLEDAADPLDRDDRAVVLVPSSPKLPVVIVGAQAGASPVARALAADPQLALTLLDAEAYTRADVPSDALEVFLDLCPSARKGRDAIVFGPPPGRCLEVDVADPSPTLRTLSGFRSDDPRVRFLSFDDVHAEHATTLRPRGGEGILAEDRRGALVVDASTPARMLSVVGFSLAHSDFAAKRSFVVFLRNLTELAERHRTRAGRTDLRAGEAATLAVPEDVTRLALDGEPVIAHAGETVVTPRPRAGLSILSWTEPHVGAQLVPVGFGAPSESDLSKAFEGTRHTPSAPLASPLARWIVLHSQLLLALCILLVLTLELIVFARRPGWAL